MLATIIDMQINKKPYSVKLVPLYQAGTPIEITVPEALSASIHNNFACGDTIKYSPNTNGKPVLSSPLNAKYTYDTMLVESMRNTVDTDGVKYTLVQLFGKEFGCQTIKMYTNNHNVYPGDEVLVWQAQNHSLCIEYNLSFEERRKKFLAKQR